MRSLMEPEMHMGAVFDRSRKYRYLLWRRWDDSKPGVCFVMLNPSTADHTKNDPTITRCIRYAQSWGYGSLDVVNLFAFRVTDSSVLANTRRPVGPQNDAYVVEALSRNETIVFAWGNHGLLHSRHEEMLKLARHVQPHCLGITKLGQPKHPLYIANDAVLIPYSVSAPKHCSKPSR